MRIVVTGATGNIGTGVVRALDADPQVETIVGLARRPAEGVVTADVERDDLVPHLRGADAVVHLAWLFQPTRRPERTWRANVLGSMRVFEAAAAAGVPKLVYTSSIGAYSPRTDDEPVTEDWPTHGWPGAAYTREKAYLERYLDAFEGRHPKLDVVRMRPGFVFQRSAATEQRRLFAGPFVPGSLVRLLPVVPDIRGLRFQIVHTDDLADAVRRAVTRPVRGAFNIATGPVVDPRFAADLLGARTIPVPAAAVRAAVEAAWRVHAIPASPGLFDAVMRLPVMSTARAESELDWQPGRDAAATLKDFLAGLREGAGAETAPLAPDRHRLHEIATGVGRRP
ncbi:MULTISPECIES: NAD-dependent epimerase/dehydratase family protein [unclassified Amycolatopsis]|uniref:NAD-dependent epimerase/dehydratase family protein n=1 Tax=unclassified Amycolatopsis TaxID=2618356 RepID=UPI002875F270|nr:MULTISPECIES: NAD-dependent epimerase/dehydratase family protein [unclassified Amycolatopsis]MDS0132203.1 NAD-dependent epimerase/dehydratase family protein [Amycolatopsis sp. 505]MDS0141059.1 NAD-dependent epimerase/dehydratase family protein [Amycolatopsis sp. CM201R]